MQSQHKPKNTKNQSELATITSSWRQTQENACDQVATRLSLTSVWGGASFV